MRDEFSYYSGTDGVLLENSIMRVSIALRHGRRARDHQATSFRVIYFLLRRLLGVVALRIRGEGAKDADLLVLRHER